MVEWLVQRGLHGLYPNGSTGEFTRFDASERRAIVEIVTDQAAGRAMVMAGASEHTVDATIEACAHYHSLGCTTAAIVPPWYYPVQQPNVREYFLTVAEHSPIDITIYKIPQFTSDVQLETLVRLAEHPRIIGIKDSSRDLAGFLVMMNEIRPFRPDFSFLIGCEEILLPSLLMGGDGGTIATSGVVPELIVKLYDLALARELDAARDLQYALLRLIKQLVFGVEFPEGVRVALEARGFSMGRSRLPLSPEVSLDRGQVQSALQTLLAGLGCSLTAEADGPAGVCAGPTGSAAAADDDSLREIIERVVRKLAAEGR